MISQHDIHHARILIVDDQLVNVEFLQYLLQASGYQSVSATTDPRVVADWHAAQHYDLIVLDLQMPEMSGFEVMAALKPLEADAWLPVLVVTAQPDHKIRALEMGARDFLSKPFEPLEVLTRIRNLLEVRLLHREVRRYNAGLEQTVRDRTATLQRFRSAMDATADAIFLLDASRAELLDVNAGACRMLAYRADELVGQSASRLGLGSPVALRALTAQLGLEGAPAMLQELELMRSDLVAVPVELSWQRMTQPDLPGQPAGQPVHQPDILLGVARDLSERRQASEQLQRMAHYDSLTGLPNRTLFFRTLEATIGLATSPASCIVVMFIALDRFKSVNDTLGSRQGDELLRQFSNRLVQCVRLRDTVGRMGGDEFALILSVPREQLDPVQTVHDVRATLRRPFELDGHRAELSASIGIAIFPDDAADAQTLVQYADIAMERARQTGRDGFRFYTAGMNAQVAARLDLEVALRRAIEEDQLLLYYQPKVRLDTGQLAGAEALLRWQRPDYGLVYPAEFVAVLEDTGMIVRVGAWIIDTACRQISQWLRNGVGPVRIAVNVASRQFVECELAHVVQTALQRHSVPAELLELELTETALMSNTERTIGVLSELRALGLKVAIDDFGTGYSSLAYLQRFPIDKLKIDIAFVRDITTNPNDAAIAHAIIHMAHSLKLRVIAEGVETEEQLDYLRSSDCDEIQGFLYSRPLTATDLAALVCSGRRLVGSLPVPLTT